MEDMDLGLFPIPAMFQGNVDCSSEGVLAYAFRQNVILLDVRSEIPLFKEVATIGKTRTTGVRFSKNPHILAISSESGSISVCDINHGVKLLVCLSELLKVYAMEWLNNSENIMFAAVDSGIKIIEWNYIAKTSRYLGIKLPAKISALCSNPWDFNTLAVGLCSGDIYVIDVSQYAVKTKLKGHTQDVYGISWSPFAFDQVLSSGKDNLAIVWSSCEKKILKKFHINYPNSGKMVYYCYPYPLWHPTKQDSVIVCSDNSVGIWNTHGTGKSKFQPFHSSRNHKQEMNHFICTQINKYNNNVMFTFGLDRKFCMWDIAKRQEIFAVPLLGGNVTDLAFSPHAYGRLLIGVGDSLIRVWNLKSLESYSIMCYPLRGHIKISAVAAHPERGNILAFGTVDGRLGIIDTDTSKSFILSELFHSDGVYKLSWAPCTKAPANEDRTHNFYMYSCGSKCILINAYDRNHLKALNFEDLTVTPDHLRYPKKPNYSEFSWKQDFSYIAVGCDDGLVEVYDGTTFELVARLTDQKRLIQSLKWHPIYTSKSSIKSDLRWWLAVSSADSVINIYDLSEVIRSRTNKEQYSVVTIAKPHKKLIGHSRSVTCVAWNPHVEGLLASSSFDYTAQVWDAITGSPLANYRKYAKRLFTVSWHPILDDIVLCGGDDPLLLLWKINKQTETRPPASSHCRNTKRKIRGVDVVYSTVKKAVLPSGDPNLQHDRNFASDESETSGKQPINDVIVKKNEGLIQNDSVNDKISYFDQMSKSRTDGKLEFQHIGRKKKKTIFPLFRAASLDENAHTFSTIKKLIDELTDNSYDKQPFSRLEDPFSHLLIYGDQKAALKYLHIESKNHQESKCLEGVQCLQMWQGSVEDMICEAADGECLNDSLVSLAPCVSYNFWLNMCERYAWQLSKNKLGIKAALYMLACRKVYEAIDVLKKADDLREAVVLAKARLHPHDPIIKSLVEEWAVKLHRDGLYWQSAKCYLSINEPSKACLQLHIVNSPQSLQSAAYICLKFGLHDERLDYVERCIQISLARNKIHIAKELLEHQPGMEKYKLVLEIQESICYHFEILKAEGDMYGVRDDAFPSHLNVKEALVWKAYSINYQNYLCHLYNCLVSSGVIPVDNASQLETYETLNNLLQNEILNNSFRNDLYSCTLCIALFFLSLLLEGNEETGNFKALRHLYHIFNMYFTCSSFSDVNSAFLLFLPLEMAWDHEKHFLQVKPLVCESSDPPSKFLFWLTSLLNTKQYFAEQHFSPEDELFVAKAIDSSTTLFEVVKKTKQILEDVAVIDAVVAYFMVNFLVFLKSHVKKNKFSMKCYSGMHDRPTTCRTLANLESQNDEDITIAIQECLVAIQEKVEFFQRKVSGKEVKVEIVESSTMDCVVMGNESEVTVIESSALVKKINDMEGKAEVKPVALNEEVSDIDKGEINSFESDLLHNEMAGEVLTEAENIQELSSSCSSNMLSFSPEEEISLSESIKDSPEETELLPSSGIPKSEFGDVVLNDSPTADNKLEPHAHCKNVTDFYFYFIQKIASVICKDAFAIEGYLRKMVNDILKELSVKFTFSDCISGEGNSKLGKSTSESIEYNQCKKDSAGSYTRAEGCLDKNDACYSTKANQVYDEIYIPTSYENFSQEANENTLPIVHNHERKTDYENTDIEVPCPGFIEHQSPLPKDEIGKLRQEYQNLAGFLKEIEKSSRDVRFPDALDTANRICELCIVVKDSSSCFYVKELSEEFLSCLENWASKYRSNESDDCA